jgi:hypothetical protein
MLKSCGQLWCAWYLVCISQFLPYTWCGEFFGLLPAVFCVVN